MQIGQRRRDRHFDILKGRLDSDFLYDFLTHFSVLKYHLPLSPVFNIFFSGIA